MARINAYARTNTPADSDVLIIDSTQGSAGTRTVPFSALKGLFADKAHKHNGSDITSAVSEATKATNDARNQRIDATYIKLITVKGTLVTVTRGDGTIFVFNTQDTNTTYTNATKDVDGLMSHQDKARLDGLYDSDDGTAAITGVSYDAASNTLHVTTVDGNSTDVVIPEATPDAPGLMSAVDKKHIDDLSAQSVVSITTAEIDAMFQI